MDAYEFCRCASSVAWLLAAALSAQAQTAVSDFRWQGFVSQSYTRSSDNRLFGDSADDGHFDFRELGLNASWRPRPDWRLAGQLTYRHGGTGERNKPQIDHALVDYSLIADAATSAGIRLGRVKNPFGFYTETRDVPFTRPSILLPQSIYFDRTRDLSVSLDGGALYLERRGGWGSVGGQIVIGRPRSQDRSTEAAFLGADRPGQLEADKISSIAQMHWESPASSWRLAVTRAHLGLKYHPGERDPIPAGTFDFVPIILSAQYNAGSWSVTSEYARRPLDVSGFGGPPLQITGESYYLQGTWRPWRQWTLLLRYDAMFVDRDDRDGARFAQASRRPAHIRFARDTTAGLRYDVTPSLMLQAEYHRVNGTGWLSTLDNPDPSATRQHWNLLLLLASYRF